MNLESVFEFGSMYPVALQTISNDIQGVSIDSGRKYLLSRFLSLSEKLGFHFPEEKQQKLNFLASEEFLNEALLKFSVDQPDNIYLSWVLGKSIGGLR